MAEAAPVVVVAEVDLRPMLRAYDAFIESLTEARNALQAEVERIEGQSRRRAAGELGKEPRDG